MTTRFGFVIFKLRLKRRQGRKAGCGEERSQWSKGRNYADFGSQSVNCGPPSFFSANSPMGPLSNVVIAYGLRATLIFEKKNFLNFFFDSMESPNQHRRGVT
ncbi:hypothetical protein BpHYR1_036055 [Brachionus plicatilis]|uniref:Uncharacterized protein n=1 Tax=Brachionus plicatilis TaxID=10195 RepID=A0A3M7RZA9_BRAPC|nr:hypothetical protein BpHYR1_036055 [Brachionus plicatilis]